MPPGTETDVNGDNRADTVVGDPYATVAWQAGAGRLIVLYGDNDGLVGEGLRDVLWQGEAEVFGTPEAGDHFVSVLGMADIDCDSYTDVVVGAPGQDIGAAANAGGVMLVQDVYASEDMVGISLDQNAAGVPGVSEAGDRCGHSVDTIRVGGASRIAIGAPGEGVGSDNSGGTVQLFRSDLENVDPGTTAAWTPGWCRSSPPTTSAPRPSGRRPLRASRATPMPATSLGRALPPWPGSANASSWSGCPMTSTTRPAW